MNSRPNSIDDLRFFDPRGALEQHKNRLPHWQQDGAAYFATFRLIDSIPQERLREWGTERGVWLARNPPPWSPEQEQDYHAQFTARIETWLEEGAGSCALRTAAIRAIVTNALAHFEGQRHWQHAWVVMPNHVHALFSTIAPHTAEDVLQSWKGFTARAANRAISQSGSFWMKDYFDRLVRDRAHFWRCARYIRRNPEKANLNPDTFTLFEAPFVKSCLDAERNAPRSGGFPAADSDSRVVQTGRLKSRPSAKP